MTRHDEHSFQLEPRIEIFVDGQLKMLPDDIGRSEDCIMPIHTDEIGNQIHVEYLRPIRFTMDDFMKVYLSSTGSGDNEITVIDNSTGILQRENVQLDTYETRYSYYVDTGNAISAEADFVNVDSLDEFPPFMPNFVGKMELKSK